MLTGVFNEKISPLLPNKIDSQDELALKTELLMQAIKNNEEKTVIKILSSPGDDSFIDFLLYQTLYYNTRNGIFSQKPKVTNSTFVESHPRTPLTLAVYLGRLNMVELLLQKGANVNLRGSCYTPLEYALFYLKILQDKNLFKTYQKILDLLIQYGAILDKDTEDKSDQLAKSYLPVIIHTVKMKK